MELRDTTDNFDVESDQATAMAPKPNTLAVLSLLVLAAAIFSYLGAYAATNALASAEIIRPISHDHDPRLRWALSGFVVLMVFFGMLALVFRIIGRRQVRKIDRMIETDA
jgi:uncharacterized BrkB/YihY/UPF0761 family membrane protein